MHHVSLRSMVLAALAVLLCTIVLLGFESSSLFMELRSSAIRTAFLRGSTSGSRTGAAELKELMTPELIAQIASQENDCLKPMHVHLVWIGDIDKAPPNRLKYTDMGYELTVHTSVEEILDGFQPYVLKAYKQAIPNVVGYDFLKLAMLYKFGGLAADADTFPAIPASEIQWPTDCDVVLGKEARANPWEKPIYRRSGANVYGLNRPFQILNWAMAASAPRNPHVKRLMEMAMMHFFGLRDMEFDVVQDVSGSGLMTDYVAMLHEQEGRSYFNVFQDGKHVPVQRLCLTDGYLYGAWIHHDFHGSWKNEQGDVTEGGGGELVSAGDTGAVQGESSQLAAGSLGEFDAGSRYEGARITTGSLGGDTTGSSQGGRARSASVILQDDAGEDLDAFHSTAGSEANVSA
ncbi:hypothetical protein Gpo141_00012323 [Globisporangium polare]